MSGKMRSGLFVVPLFLVSLLPARAGLLAVSDFDPARFLPPPPAADSAATRTELAELRALAAKTGAEGKRRATHDAKDETPDIFNAAIGFDIARTPKTRDLLQMVVVEEDVDSKVAKKYFHRLRPYAADTNLKTCEPTKPNKPANSYPSGHATLAFSMGVVLAQLLPQKAQAILARSSEYSENRLICGVHYRSDIVAGQQFGTILALKLMQVWRFRQALEAAKTELRATHRAS